MRVVEAVPSRDYPIVITEGYDTLNEEINKLVCPSQICIITDTNVAPLYLEKVKKQLEGIAPLCDCVFEAGEHSKTLVTVQHIYNRLIEEKIDRSGLIIALGGGVVGDLAGFVASSYMRGIPFVQLPTTIVSQNDSSIGGKVGVDYHNHKNMVGAFYNPILIYTNIKTLETLPQREFHGGMSEVIKHGLIFDRELHNYLLAEKNGLLSKDSNLLMEMTYQSCRVKCYVVENDLKEAGLRKILNFGHTIGHAIESLSQFSLNHGECVAYGMLMAAYISYKRGYIEESIVDEIIYLSKIYGLLEPMPHFNHEEVIAQMTYDKKKSHGTITFILLEAIGVSCMKNDVSADEVYDALTYAAKTCL